MRALRGKEVENGGSRSAGTATGDKAAKVLGPANGSKLWLGLRDPRIVRVSRAYGGKDRHSKVSTVKGLRDRRVRLSVPTAIQLYDLQDRLGLSQPSKVVDWLLAATQEEIDKLPPLPIPPSGLPLHQCSGGPAITHAPPPATALCMANGYGGGGVDYLDGTDGNLIASTCYNAEEPTGEAGGLFSNSEGVTPLTFLPSSQGQFLFCAPNGMAMAAPIFPSYAATSTPYMTATASSFPSDFSSLLKSSVFSRSQQRK